MKIMKKYWFQGLVVLLLGIAVILFSETLWSQWQQFELDFSTIRWYYLVGSLIGFTLIVGWHAFVWRSILPAGDRVYISLGATLRIHAMYWLTRYIPGTAPTLISKVVAGQKYGIPKRTLALASLYEQLIQLFSALAIGIILSLSTWNLDISPMWISLVTILSFLGTFIILRPRIFYPIANRALHLLGKHPLAPESLLSYSKLLYLTGLFIVGQIGNGVAFFALVKAFVPIENSLMIPFIGFYSLAGVIGVLAVFVPSGIGVREGVLVSLLSPFMPVSVAISISIAARLVNTISDGLIFLTLGIYKIRRLITQQVIFGLWSMILFAIMIMVSQAYSSSYIDEYWHIFAGRNFLQEGGLNSLYSTGPYERGMIVSILSGMFQLIFGDQLWIQKLIPVGISMGIYGGLMALSRQVWSGQLWVSFLLGGIWVLSPWLMFNHQYIRVYVWYEFIFVAGLWLVLWSSDWSWRRWVMMQISVLGGLWGVYLTANDNAVLLPIVGVFFAQAIVFITRPTIGKMTHWLRVVMIGAGSLAVVSSVWGKNLILSFLNQDFMFATQESYRDFFLERNTLVSVFALVGIGIWLVRGTIQQRILALVCSLLVTLHFISSPDVQLIRSIFYLLPLIYVMSLVPIWFVYQSKYLFGKIVGGLLLAILVLGVYQSYPLQEGFLAEQHLFIPEEIYAVDYQVGYQYITDNCHGKTLYETSPTPYVGQFYGVDIDAVVITQREWLEQDTIFRPISDENYVVHYSNVPVITNIQDLDTHFCWIQRTPSLERYLSGEALNIQAEITDFVGLRIVKK